MIKYHTELVQGSDEWLAARLGILTASEVCKIVTPTGKIANNDKTRAHVWEIAAQRITRYVEPYYVGDEMLRGKTDEIIARDLYDAEYLPVDEVGFVTNDQWGFTIGYSPDGLVGMDGLIECKSRRQRFQFETLATREVPEEYLLQIQTGLLVSGREWLDFVSYSGGMPMFVKRVYPDPVLQDAIIKAATAFDASVQNKIEDYFATCDAPDMRLIPTERVVEQEMV